MFQSLLSKNTVDVTMVGRILHVEESQHDEHKPVKVQYICTILQFYKLVQGIVYTYSYCMIGMSSQTSV